MKIMDPEFLEIMAKLDKLKKRFKEHAFHTDPRKDSLMELFEKKMEAQGKLKVIFNPFLPTVRFCNICCPRDLRLSA